MLDRQTLNALRQNPMEWRRRGLTPPDAIQRMVDERVNGLGPGRADPSYSDFFSG